MATTTNFGWETPDDTDLVKDGALAMRTLGNAIDTSMADLKGGTTGQVLSKTSNTDMDFTWVTTDDADAIQNSIVDAKGDLIAASADNTPARLAVGSDGDTLVADSAASTGLRWQGNYAAGKNQCINGAFDIWQRGTSFAGNVFTADRWQTQTNKTVTVSRQSFTAGTAPVAGYEGTYFLRQTYSADGSYGALQTKLEDSRLFAGQTITLSYWAKADATYSNTPSINQNFGSGGSTAVTTNGTTHNITTTWARYSSVITVPSISGKTIGTGSYFMLQPILIESAGARTIDIWGVQVEAGNVATAFQTATGTLQGELAACQRYYYRAVTPENAYGAFGTGMGRTGTTAYGLIPLPVPMRISPTSIEYSTVRIDDGSASTGSATAISINSLFTSRNLGALDMTFSSGVTQYRPYVIEANNSTAAYVAFSAEL